MIVGFENYKNKYQFRVTGIIHVGAHIGQEYEEYMDTFGSVETHWFEPVDSVFSKLSENLSGKPGVSLYNFGLGENSFTTKMFIDSGNDAQSSSILKPKLHTEEFPHIEFPESSQIEIKVEKLDNFFIESWNMLVLDTQGYELNVLKGSILTLKNIDYIFTEFNTIEMYENCPTLEDIDNFLREFGFERLETWYTSQNWGDAMYIREKKDNVLFRKSEKSIVIIDCFISDKNIESDLINQIEKFKKQNLDILLISNTKVSIDIQQKVDYFIYDKRNQLFQYEYTNLEEITLKDYVYIDKDWQFTTNMVTNGLQRHGLSVLVNLFNAVNLAKSLGYKNFWRVEVDDLFCDKSLKFIKSCPDLLDREDKKAILYYNSNNISFHFMFWNIDYFLEKIPQIRNEEDYKNLILKHFDSLDFIIAEQFIYKFLKINGDSEVLVKDGQNMSLQFPNTVWNTNMSLSNMSPKYENCPSLIFKMNNKSGLFIFTKNYSNEFKSRRIIVYYPDYTETIIHEAPQFNTWCWNIVAENVYKYEVYENDKLLYVEECKDIKNYVEFP